MPSRWFSMNSGSSGFASGRAIAPFKPQFPVESLVSVSVFCWRCSASAIYWKPVSGSVMAVVKCCQVRDVKKLDAEVAELADAPA